MCGHIVHVAGSEGKDISEADLHDMVRGSKDSRKHKSVTVDPIWVLWVECHELVEQDVGNGRHAHRRTRVTRVGLGRGIDLCCKNFISVLSIDVVTAVLSK